MFVQLASNYNALPVSRFIFYPMQFYNFYLPKCGFYRLGYYLIMFTLHQFYLQTKLVNNKFS